MIKLVVALLLIIIQFFWLSDAAKIKRYLKDKQVKTHLSFNSNIPEGVSSSSTSSTMSSTDLFHQPQQYHLSSANIPEGNPDTINMMASRNHSGEIGGLEEDFGEVAIPHGKITSLDEEKNDVKLSQNENMGPEDGKMGLNAYKWKELDAIIRYISQQISLLDWVLEFRKRSKKFVDLAIEHKNHTKKNKHTNRLFFKQILTSQNHAVNSIVSASDYDFAISLHILCMIHRNRYGWQKNYKRASHFRNPLREDDSTDFEINALKNGLLTLKIDGGDELLIYTAFEDDEIEHIAGVIIIGDNRFTKATTLAATKWLKTPLGAENILKSHKVHAGCKVVIVPAPIIKPMEEQKERICKLASISVEDLYEYLMTIWDEELRENRCPTNKSHVLTVATIESH